MNKELMEALEKALAIWRADRQSSIPSDQHLLADGWIRHTRDFCPIHELDRVVLIFADGSRTGGFAEEAVLWNWGASDLRITHYKVTKKYVEPDLHAENKALYAKDAKVHKEPWKLWEYLSHCDGTWWKIAGEPLWLSNYQYRRKKKKPQRVSWSCPLLKGANTNYGELLFVEDGYFVSGKTCELSSVDCLPDSDLRLAPPANDKSNWQAYNGENLSLLHEAGFVVQVKYWDTLLLLYALGMEGCLNYCNIAAYRVIAIRAGFTDDEVEAK